MQSCWRSCHLYNACYNSAMNMPLKLIKVGNSTAAILPKELLARLRVELGDTIYASEIPGGVRLTPSNPDFETKMAAAEKIMREDRDILHVLAQ
jgi:putative addiction module antidote